VELNGIGPGLLPATPIVSTVVGPMSLQRYVYPDDANAWKVLPVTPWRRYAARTLDTALHGSIGFFLIGLGLYSVAPLSADRAVEILESSLGGVLNYVLSSLMAVPIGALLLGTSGSTLGKFLFGVRVHNVENAPIGVVLALKREVYVWFAGLGLGIPIVMIFCLVAAKRRLERTGFTSWDQGNGYVVTHRPSGIKQVFMSIVGISIFIGLVSLLYSL